MNRFRFSTYTFFCVVNVLLLFSCRKFVAIEAPKTALSSSALFTSDEGAVSAVSGLYSEMGKVNLVFTNGGFTVFTGLSGDELENTTVNPNYDPFRSNALTPDNFSISSRFWNPAYKIIFQVNAILEGLEHGDRLSDNIKKTLRGEMLFVRAYSYFYLVNVFGAVPYLTTTDYHVNAVAPRTPVPAVYAALTVDLTEAMRLLPASYSTDTRVRPNKWTAGALLARVMLYQENWAQAATEADTILAAGSYSLPATEQVFQPSSPEVIWQLQRENANTAEGNVFIPPSSTSRPALRLRDALLNAFETGDQRLATWTGKSVVNGQTSIYPYKYKVRSGLPVAEYLVQFRLAELYLIRAEARAHLGQIAEGLSDVNMLRSRAGLAPASAHSIPSLLQLIERERQFELFAEGGHRWFDLKRTGRADAVLASLKGSDWQSTDQLYPLPLEELQKNRFLTQNPGY